MDILYFITEPLTHEFMQRGLLIAAIIATICAVFSCFIILKGWSLMGDAISHAVLPGLVAAYVLGLPLAAGAFAAGFGSALAVGFLKDHSRLREDTVLAIVFSGMFAMGLVMMTKVESDIHLLHVLFGNMLGVSWGDIIQTGIIAAISLVIIALKWKDLLLWCFDPAHAQTIGLPSRVMHFCSLAFLALTIVAALKAAGIILVVAMLIAPGATAYLLSRNFSAMILISLAVSLSSCLAGTILSFHIDAATAPLIVVLQAGIFVSALLLAPGTGLLRSTRHEQA